MKKLHSMKSNIIWQAGSAVSLEAAVHEIPAVSFLTVSLGPLTVVAPQRSLGLATMGLGSPG